ncbi:MAG: toll/interleukin-1 receptor domain-containing protein, partial [Chloroflexi bacterium]|nr:toll/interleukin-1 receptor domain-containing protein [Chloroflexota bacterium]
ATRLTEDLNAAGVRTWKWDMDAVPGRTLRENIDVGIRNYDKLILVCSQKSLTSKAVDREIETALQKEERLSNAAAERAKEALLKGEPPPYVDTKVLVPIRLDDTVFNWTSPLAPQVNRVYIPDFGKTRRGSKKYQRELQRLINALNPSTWPPVK